MVLPCQRTSAPVISPESETDGSARPGGARLVVAAYTCRMTP
jgi:hypothetical protein